MNDHGQPSDLATSAEDSFFSPVPQTGPGDGREAHALVKADPAWRFLPSDRQIGWFLFGTSLVLYVASLSWAPFPGLPTQALLLHLGMDGTPGILEPLWGRLIRMLARLPGLSVAGWAGLFSALCGAASIGLIGRLMVRVGYLVRNEPQPESFAREAQARRLSGLVAGLYLAVCIPFWMVATRSLPGTFHAFLLLAAGWFFSEYQLWGKRRHLAWLGLIYGVGLAEFPTFFVYLPLAVVLGAREMFRWRALRSWKPHLALWGGLLTGLLLYPLHAYALFRQGAGTGLWASPWQAWVRVLQEQALRIIQLPNQNPMVFLYIMFFSLAAWLLLFTMSHRSPWFYESGQVLVRLLFVAGLLGILYNASFAPWRLLGMGQLLVTPYLLLAICIGYMAGEFWILGESQPLVDSVFARRFARRARRVSAVFALSLPAIIAAGGIHNWRVVDGRTGEIVATAAAEILDRLDGQDILFSSGLLDDSLRMAAWERKIPVHVISVPRTASDLYLNRLAEAFADDRLKFPLLQGDFGTFVENLLLSESGPARTAIIDLPDVFREYGYVVPDGFLYRLETSGDRVDCNSLVASQRPFWERMELMAADPVPQANLIRVYQDRLRLLASKVANNLGVLQAERGDESGAVETFRVARRICPDNLSVLMNLLEIGRSRELPEAAELESDWEARLENLRGERWALAIQYGYVWRARAWVRRGRVWALSGAPTSAEAARRNLSASDAGLDQQAQLLGQVYLRWGLPPLDEAYYCAQLIQDDKNAPALMELGRLALARNDPEAAEAYMAEALAMGMPEQEILFDRAMTAYVREGNAPALESLQALARLTPGDPRVWLALVMLGDEHDPLNAQAMKTLKSHRAAGISVRLALASVHMARGQWAEAQAELEQAVLVDSQNTQTWEMLVTLAQERGNQALMETGLRALLERNPEHFLHYQNQGVAHYFKGELAEAEATFRKGIDRTRAPVLLNNLAHVILKRGGDLEEARGLLDEALRRQPGDAGFLSTRGEVFLAMGRYEEARLDLQASLKKRGRHNNLLLLLARSYEGLGDRPRALAVAAALTKQADQLDAGQKAQLDSLRARLR